MDKRTLSVVKRTSVGKNSLKSLRREGFIPAVMYGHSENTLFSVDEREFSKKFKTISENKIIDLIDGKSTFHVLIKDFDEDVMKGEILHIDFYEVEKGKKLHTSIPVHVEGNAIGTREGGILENVLHEIQVECLPKDIPEAITVNVSELQIGQSIHISDLEKIKGVKILTSADQVVSHVSRGKAAEVETASEEETEEAETQE